MIRRVIVGLSGGVDSSVAALLLLRRGFDVQGVYMRNWDASDEAGAGLAHRPCPGDGDLASARAAAAHLGIPLATVDFSREYWGGVFEAWVAGYRAGATPNPDAACNRVVKFGAFRAHALGALRGDAFATGHYAQLWPDLGRAPGASSSSGGGGELPRLFSAVDARKDQSDFLATVPGSALARAIFPLGAHTKAQVRALARAAGLPTAARPDSMGICFVGRRALAPFLAQYLAPTPARAACLATGRLLGPPPPAPPPIACAEALTCGQRLGLGGLPEPHYVVSNGVLGQRERSGSGSGSGGSSTVVWAVPGRDHAALYATVAAVALPEFHAVAGALPAALAGAAAEARGRAAGDAAEWAAQALLPWLRGQQRSAAATDAAAAAAAAAPTLSTPAPPHVPAPVASMPALFRERHGVQSVGEAAAAAAAGEGAGADGGSSGGESPAAPAAVTIVRAEEFFAACALLHTRRAAGQELGHYIPSWRAAAGAAAAAGAGAAGQEQRQHQLLLLVRPARPVRAASPGQVLVLYSAEQWGGGAGGRAGAGAAAGSTVATAPLPISEAPLAGEAVPPQPQGSGGAPGAPLRHGGRLVYGGGSILCTGPSLFDMGLARW